ncbi:MAG: radical SAM protein [Nanoarchaeota archaeon]
MENLGFIIKNTINHIKQNMSYYLNKPISFPTIIHFAPTLRCNLRCRYCSIWEEGNIKKEISLEDWKKFLLEMSKWVGKAHIGITGGEPLLRKDIFEILGFMNKLGLKTSFTTNGTLLDDKTIGKLSKLNLFNINISLESIDEIAHDFFRGDGNFNKTMNNLLKLKKAIDEEKSKILVVVETTVNSENILLLPDILKFCEKNNLKIHFGNIVEKLKINYNGNYNEESEYKPKKNDWEKIIGSFNFLIKNKKNILNSKDELKMMRDYYTGKKINFKCSAVARNLFVSSDGDVKLCQYFPAIGNIKEENVKRIWYSEKANEQRKKIKKCTKICQFDCYKRKSLYEEYEMYKAMYS